MDPPESRPKQRQGSSESNGDHQTAAMLRQFAESLVDRIIAEAYEIRATNSQAAEAPADETGGGGGGQLVRLAGGGKSSGLAEWTREEKNGTLSHMVEQTAFVEAKPRGESVNSSSKKQRRRKSEGGGGLNAEGPADCKQQQQQDGYSSEDERLAEGVTIIKTTTTIISSGAKTNLSATAATGLANDPNSCEAGELAGPQQLCDLAGKFQTAGQHAQATGSGEAAHADPMSFAKLLEAGGPKSLDSADYCSKRSPPDPEQIPRACVEPSLRSSAAAVASAQGEQQTEAEGQEEELCELGAQLLMPTTEAPIVSVGRYGSLPPPPPDNPDLDISNGHGGGSRSYVGECNLQAAEASEPEPEPGQEEQLEKAPSPLDGFESSGDFSITTTSTTTTEDTTIIMATAQPPTPPELNVNVNSETAATATTPFEMAQEQWDADESSMVPEGFMGAAQSGEGAKRGLGDLDSGERTRGWGCSEQGIQTKFKDTGPRREIEAEQPVAMGSMDEMGPPLERADAPGGSREEQPTGAALLQPSTSAGESQAATKVTTASSILEPEQAASGDDGDLERHRIVVGLEGEEIRGIDIELVVKTKQQPQPDGASSNVGPAASEPRLQLRENRLDIEWEAEASSAEPLDTVVVVARGEGGVEEFTHQASGTAAKGFTNSRAPLASQAELSSTVIKGTKTTNSTSGAISEQRRLKFEEAGTSSGPNVSSSSCSSVVPGDNTECSGGSSSSGPRLPADIAKSNQQQRQQPTRPSSLSNASHNNSKNNRNLTRRILAPDDESPPSPSSSSSPSTSRQRPKSELIGAERLLSSQEYFAATDSERNLHEGTQTQPEPKSRSSSQGQITDLSQQPQNLHQLDSSISSSSSSYATAPLPSQQLPTTSSSSNLDFVTLSTSLSLYETARSSIRHTNNSATTLSSPTSATEDTTTSEMVSFSVDDRLRSQSQAGASSGADTPTMTPNTEELEEMDAMVEETSAGVEEPDDKVCAKSVEHMKIQSPTPGPSQHQQQQQQLLLAATIRQDSEILLDDSIDEEQLRRILACKRLSEGCNRFGSNFVARKNSLHMIEELPPLTEGETMKHMSYHLSQTIDQSTTSSSSSGSLRVGLRPQSLMRDLALKRGSQDENTTSCSSSTSLERSPTRRRSSTVSQCSSVLSESTRNQLNFDLSPDLAPNSSLFEANAISPTADLDRPASPEPSSLSGEAFEFRPISRMSNEDQMIIILPSPDSTLGDSNDANEPMEGQHLMGRLTQSCLQQQQQQQDMEVSNGAGDSESSSSSGGGDRSNQLVLGTTKQTEPDDRRETTITKHLERIISDVSSVAVSVKQHQQPLSANSSKRPAMDDDLAPGRFSKFQHHKHHHANSNDDQHQQIPTNSCGQILRTARSSSFGQQQQQQQDEEAQRRSSGLRRCTTKAAAASSSSGRAHSDSPESPGPHPAAGARPKSVATNRPTSFRPSSRSSIAAGQHLTQNTPSPSANSTCSSTSSLSSSGAATTTKTANRATRAKNNNNDHHRLLHVIEMEQKDTHLRHKRRQATISPISDTWPCKQADSVKRFATQSPGHRHTSQESGPLCYCHNF